MRIVTELRAQGTVAVVGDGINDAPALATATVGLAMGAMVATSPSRPPMSRSWERTSPTSATCFGHARRAGRIMRQNLVQSDVIIGVLIPLAATHELPEVLFIANGVRAGRNPRPIDRGADCTPLADPALTARREERSSRTMRR